MTRPGLRLPARYNDSLPEKSFLLFSEISLLLSATVIAVASAAAGVWFTGAWKGGRKLVPFSAGLLVGLALFAVGPEIAEHFGWAAALALVASGFLLLWLVDRFLYPVCPSCSHTHDHAACEVTLHGFALPLAAAGILHSFMDGWGISASLAEGSDLGLAFALGVALHKVPEGLAYGSILRAALQSRVAAIGWCAVIQAPTVLGGFAEAWVAPQLGVQWVGVPLAVAGGSFLYLGIHAVHNEWKRRGWGSAFGPALTGAAGAAALHQGLRLLLR